MLLHIATMFCTKLSLLPLITLASGHGRAGQLTAINQVHCISVYFVGQHACETLTKLFDFASLSSRHKCHYAATVANAMGGTPCCLTWPSLDLFSFFFLFFRCVSCINFIMQFLLLSATFSKKRQRHFASRISRLCHKSCTSIQFTIASAFEIISN